MMATETPSATPTISMAAAKTAAEAPSSTPTTLMAAATKPHVTVWQSPPTATTTTPDAAEMAAAETAAETPSALMAATSTARTQRATRDYVHGGLPSVMGVRALQVERTNTDPSRGHRGNSEAVTWSCA